MAGKHIADKKEKLLVRGFKPFIGKHCETSALGKVLAHYGLSISEDMLLGLGGGIGFIYWHMKKMPYPFIGGRNGRFPGFLAAICGSLGAASRLSRTTSAKKGYEELKSLLRMGKPAIVYGDIAYLHHFASNGAHFGGHAFVVFGLDEEKGIVSIYDRGKEPIELSIAELEKARSSKFPPFPPKHALLFVDFPSGSSSDKIDLRAQIRRAVNDCCAAMVNPPLQSFGLSGINKWSKTIMEWPKMFNHEELFDCLVGSFINIEIGGTGGSAFRSMYARFLREAGGLSRNSCLLDAAELIGESAKAWNRISAGLLPDSNPRFKRTRELLLMKNRLFENQDQNSSEKMKEINTEIGKIRSEAAGYCSQAPKFLADVQREILDCHAVECKAFDILIRN
jgi:hypothetical protein